MATMLGKKAVSRELKDWRDRGLFGLGHGGKCRNLVVTLEPGNLITFREKGLRSQYTIDIESVFNMAVKRCILRTVEEKRKAKKT